MNAVDYIKKYGVERGLFINEAAEKINDYFEELPEGFENSPYKDWILEALNSHDRAKLKKTLRSRFDITEFENEAGARSTKLSAFSFYWDPEEWVTNHGEEDDENNCERAVKALEDTVKFFGWYITKLVGWLNRWIVAPTYAQNKTNYIKTTCKGYVYHLCNENNVKSISEKGLRCKTPEYRYFPERIYVIGAAPRNIKNTIEDLIHGEIDHFDNPSTYILKIKTGKEDYYTDDIMENTHTFYTYNNIPAKNIESIYNLYTFLKY